MEQHNGSPAGTRLWRPAAQRRVRNAWSSMFAEHTAWVSASAKGLSVANALVNALLSERYLPTLDLGALHDMVNIREKAHLKLLHQQEGYFDQLLEIYQDLVKIICRMTEASKSMRTYVKGPINRPLVEFSSDQKLDGDFGDGGGAVIFSTLSLQSFERLAEELVAMFVSELNVKRLLISEMHSAVLSSELKRQFQLDKIEPCESSANLMKSIDSKNICFPKTLNSAAASKNLNILPERDSSTQLSREILQYVFVDQVVQKIISSMRDHSHLF
ncbi:hypothetical protein O6H91_05G052700 [Diphasiastrum complanatum]|uniref:Uncharacterized protein n=1 Tax=Diphasiastrum complanatum TaxID=34168 RepID=A0ACC2DNC2_DIPCM|nr:hypothetical protein O6H91_05G052700 [Diphasiastrum complanatum]